MPEIRVTGGGVGGGGAQLPPSQAVKKADERVQETQSLLNAAAQSAQLVGGLVKEARAKQDRVDLAEAEGQLLAAEEQVKSRHTERLSNEPSRFFEDRPGFVEDATSEFNANIDGIKKGKSAAVQARVDELVARRSPVLLQDIARQTVEEQDAFNTRRQLSMTSGLMLDAAEKNDLGGAIAAAQLGLSTDLGETGNQQMRGLVDTALNNLAASRLANPETALDTAVDILSGGMREAVSDTVATNLTIQARNAVNNVWMNPNSQYGPKAITAQLQSVITDPEALDEMAIRIQEDIEFSSPYLSASAKEMAQLTADRVGAAQELSGRAQALAGAIQAGVPQALNATDPSHQLAAEMHWQSGLSQFAEMQPGEIINFAMQNANSGIISNGLTNYIAGLNYSDPRDLEVAKGMMRVAGPPHVKAQLTSSLVALANKAAASRVEGGERTRGVQEVIGEQQQFLAETGRADAAMALNSVTPLRASLWADAMEGYRTTVGVEARFKNTLERGDVPAVAAVRARSYVRKQLEGMEADFNDSDINAGSRLVAAHALGVFSRNPGLDIEDAFEIAATEVYSGARSTQFSAKGYGYDAPETVDEGLFEQLVAESEVGQLQNFRGRINPDTIKGYEVVGLDAQGNPSAWTITLQDEEGRTVPLTGENGSPFILRSDKDRQFTLQQKQTEALVNRQDEDGADIFDSIDGQLTLVGRIQKRGAETAVNYLANKLSNYLKVETFDPDAQLTKSAAQKLEDPMFLATHAPLPSASRMLGAMAVELEEFTPPGSDPRRFREFVTRVQGNGHAFSREDIRTASELLDFSARVAHDQRAAAMEAATTDTERAVAESKYRQSLEQFKVTKAQVREASRYLKAMEVAGDNTFSEGWQKRLSAFELWAQTRDQLGIDYSAMTTPEIEASILEWARAGGMVDQMVQVGQFSLPAAQVGEAFGGSE